MGRATVAIFGILLLVAGVACSSREADYGEKAEQASSELPDPVSVAIAITGEIESNPERAEEILEEHGMTEEAFDELMYRIAADPALREAYNAARGGSE